MITDAVRRTRRKLSSNEPRLLLAFNDYLDGLPLSECATRHGLPVEPLADLATAQEWDHKRRDLIAAKLQVQKKALDVRAEQQRRATSRHYAVIDDVLTEAEALLNKIRANRDGSREANIRDLCRLSDVVATQVRSQRLVLELDTDRVTNQAQADSVVEAIREFMADTESDSPGPRRPAQEHSEPVTEDEDDGRTLPS